PTCLFLFLIYSSAAPRSLHSFPTRRSSDLTSHDVVARVRKILKTRRVGHTGTLDPFATGVLVVCVNRATRLAQFLTRDDKEYIRSEEHTSELQSLTNLVCRLLLEKKNNINY